VNKQITLINFTGNTPSPYFIYLCESGGTNCMYINTVSTPPYSFTVPSLYENLASVKIKIKDTNNCENSVIVNL
jgi:hypothetical protein